MDLAAGAPVDGEQHRGRAPGRAAVQRDAVDGAAARSSSRSKQRVLVRLDRGHRLAAPGSRRSAASGVEVGDEVDRGGDAGEQLVGQRAELEPLGHRVAWTAAACRGAASRAAPGAAASAPRCGPKNLYGEQAKKSAPSAATSTGACGARCTPSTYTSAPTSCAAPAIAGTSGRVPSRLEAPVTATSRVRVGQHGLEVVELGGRRGSKSTQRTVAPARSAASTQGRMLASWSSRVTTTSSPGPQSFARVRATSKVSWVIERPKTTPPGSAPSRSAIAARAPTTIVLGAALGLGDRAPVGERRRSARRRPPRRPPAAPASRPARRSGRPRRRARGSGRGRRRRRTRCRSSCRLRRSTYRRLPAAQTNALSPVIARPTISVLISRVPS